MKIPKSHGTSEFKELTVTRVRAGHSARAVAMELRLIEQTLRNRGEVAMARAPARGRGPCLLRILQGLFHATALHRFQEGVQLFPAKDDAPGKFPKRHESPTHACPQRFFRTPQQRRSAAHLEEFAIDGAAVQRPCAFTNARTSFWSRARCL